MSKQKELSLWKDRLLVTENLTKGWRKDARRFIDYYKGYYYFSPAASLEEDRVAVNLVFSTVKTIVPAIYAKNPEIICKPKREIDVDPAKLMRSVLNYTIKEIELKRTMKRVLTDSLLTSLGVVKVGYSFETIEQVLTPEEFAKKSPEAQEYLKNLPQNKRKAIPTVQEVIKRDSVWAMRWSPFDFFVDPEATSPNLEDARWIAFRSVKPLEAIRNQYDSTVSSPNIYEGAKILDAVETKADFKRGIVWEVWDKEHLELIVFIEGSDKTIEWRDWPYDLEGFPAVTISFNDIPDEELPLSDVSVYEPQLKEKNLIRTQQTNHRKRFNRKYEYDESAITQDEIKKLEANIDGSYIKSKKIGSIMPIADAPLSIDVYQTENRIDTDLAILSGVIDFQRGPVSGAGPEKTATEASIIESRLRLRSSERIDILETALRDIARKLSQLIKQNYSAEHITEIYGQPAFWQPFTKEDIQGEYDIDIFVGSTLPVDRAVEIKQAADRFNLMYGKPEFNSVELGKAYLEATGEKNIEKFINPQMLLGMPGAPGGLTGMPGGAVIPGMVGEPPVTRAGLVEQTGGPQVQ